MADLLSVDRALELVLEQMLPLESEIVPLSAALGRVVAEDIRASINIPPFLNSSMDGYAVRAIDVASASTDNPVRLPVVFDIPAGIAPTHPLHPGEAARIMTGAPLPDHADAVVPVENTDSQWKPGSDSKLPAFVTVYRSVKPGDSTRQPGEDIQAGQTVLTEGTVLRAAEIGVLASLGCAQIPVIRRPRVAILANGDELIDVDAPLTPGKIRDSNSYMLSALITTYSGEPFRIPKAQDTLDDLRRSFREALDQQPDIILSSAGVSVGAFDVVRTVLAELGNINFWRINLRPGKPLAFGYLQGVPFFGLPGNPVSAMITFEIFVRPALLKLAHRPDQTTIVTAVVGEDIQSDGRRSYLRVRLTQENKQLVARPTGTQSSGVLTSMVFADGLLIIPEGMTYVPAGHKLPVRLLRDISPALLDTELPT